VHRTQMAVSGALLALLLAASAAHGQESAPPQPRGVNPGEGGASCSGPADVPPPTGSLRIAGPQVRVGDRLFAGTAARVEVTAVDGAGSPARWTPVVGGKEEAAWPSSWAPGEHTVSAVALDGCGNRGPIAPVAFVVDAAAPAIRWEVGDQKALEDRLAPDPEKERRRLKGRRSGGVPASAAWPSLAGVWQIPVPWVRDQDLTRVAHFPVEIVSDHPQAFFSAPKTALTVESREASLGGERYLWVAADDAEGAGVDRLTFRTRAEKDRVVLEVEAADLVGNVSRREIVLRQGGRDAAKSPHEVGNR
jgi:hypothetical protein